MCYHAAGDLRTGVSGRLGVEVVGAAVNDYRTAQHFLHGEPVRKHRQKGLSVAGQQWRQISRMIGMLGVFRIIVTAGQFKILFAAACNNRLLARSAPDRERHQPAFETLA